MEQVTPPKFDHQIKYVTAGDFGAGKTSFGSVYDTGVWPGDALFQIGLEFKIKVLEYNGKRVQIQLWDRQPGNTRKFKTMDAAFYRNAHGIFVMLDLTSRSCFERIPNIFDEVNRHCSPHAQKILIGTKSDLIDARVVSNEEAKKLAEDLGVRYIETSAKNNTNIVEAVELMHELVLPNIDKFVQQPPPPAARGTWCNLF